MREAVAFGLSEQLWPLSESDDALETINWVIDIRICRPGKLREIGLRGLSARSCQEIERNQLIQTETTEGCRTGPVCDPPAGVVIPQGTLLVLIIGRIMVCGHIGPGRDGRSAGTSRCNVGLNVGLNPSTKYNLLKSYRY